MRWDAGRHLAWPGAGKEFPPKVQKFNSPPHSTPSCLPSLTNLCPLRPGCLHGLLSHSRATFLLSPHTPLHRATVCSSLPGPAPLPSASWTLLPPATPRQPLPQTLRLALPRALNCSQLVIHSFAQWRHGGCVGSGNSLGSQDTRGRRVPAQHRLYIVSSPC